jgi:hypothetical protein
MADKKKHADGYGSQKWIVKDEVRAKAGLELADVIFTPEKARKTGKKASAAVSAVTATASGSASATSSSQSPHPAAVGTPTPIAKDITETSVTVTDSKTAAPPVAQTQSKTQTQTQTQTQTKGTQSPVKKAPSSKGPSSTNRTPSTGTSTAAKSSSLLRFFNKSVAAEKGAVTVPVPTQDLPPATDTISDGEMGERVEEEGKKEEKTEEETSEQRTKVTRERQIEAEAKKDPILITIEDSNQSLVLPPKAESEV